MTTRDFTCLLQEARCRYRGLINDFNFGRPFWERIPFEESRMWQVAVGLSSFPFMFDLNPMDRPLARYNAFFNAFVNSETAKKWAHYPDLVFEAPCDKSQPLDLGRNVCEYHICGNCVKGGLQAATPYLSGGFWHFIVQVQPYYDIYLGTLSVVFKDERFPKLLLKDNSVNECRKAMFIFLETAFNY